MPEAAVDCKRLRRARALSGLGRVVEAPRFAAALLFLLRFFPFQYLWAHVSDRGNIRPRLSLPRLLKRRTIILFIDSEDLTLRS